MKIFIYFIVIILFYPFTSISQTASFVASKDRDCNILKIILDASTSSGVEPLTYYWDFGNGNKISGKDKSVVEVIYNQPGKPEIKLYVIDANGNKSQIANKTVHILAGPKVDFTSSFNSSCPGKEINLINKTVQGSSPITGFLWNLGGSGTSNNRDPIHSFSKEGDYDITLIAIDENGCNVSLKKEKFISIKSKFRPAFVADSTFQCDGPLTTNYKDVTDYTEVSGHQFSYHWDFGDGTTSVEKNPQKTYHIYGSLPVFFTITDLTEGCMRTNAIQNYITVGGKKPIVSSRLVSRSCNQFTYEIKTNIEFLPAEFIKIVELGDGTIRHLKNESSFFHAYSKSGSYVLKTTYKNIKNASCTQIGYDTIIVPETDLEIVADNTSNCSIPLIVDFSIKNLNDGKFYLWDFGDGTFSEEANPIKTYTKEGKFDVHVKVWTKEGCTFELIKKKFIRTGKVTALFTSDADRIFEYPREYNYHPLKDSTSLQGGCIPLTVNFENQSDEGTGISYQWNFGDGSKTNSSAKVVTHTYLKEGKFTPSLLVIDSLGCMDTISCEECVRAGNPPNANIIMTGPDTFCCLYNKNFAAQVDLKEVDFLWYNVALNDNTPAAGVTKAFYKDSLGNWQLDNHTEEFFPFSPPGMGLDYMTTNLARPTGNQPDFYFYAYKNGCPKKIEYPKFQHHILPWGTFDPLPCDALEELKAGDTIDFNKVGGKWLIGKDKNNQYIPLSKAEISFTFLSTHGCTMPKITREYTSASLGFDLDENAFDKIKKANLFPKIVLPDCASDGDVLISNTYLFTHPDASKEYKDGKCLCEEHWPYPIGKLNKRIPYEVSSKKGCAPMNLYLKSSLGRSNSQWIFEDGKILYGDSVHRSFISPGIYRFRFFDSEIHTCIPTSWTDSIEVSAPVLKMEISQDTFCLNNNPENNPNNIIYLTDSSYSLNGSIKNRKWFLSNNVTIPAEGMGTIQYKFSPNDILGIEDKYVGLEITDEAGCSIKDSLKIILRETKPLYAFERSVGCFDSLKLIPLFPSIGPYHPFEGNIYVRHLDKNDTVEIYKKSLREVGHQPLLLDKKGKYLVHMEIDTDALGRCFAKSKDTLIIVDYQSLAPDFKIVGPHQFNCVPALVQVEEISHLWNNYSIKKWDWTIKNTLLQSEVKGTGQQPPLFALVDSGHYSVGLTVEDISGCKKTIVKDSVIFIDNLEGKIDSLPNTVCPGENIFFKGTSDNADFFFWDFGDGFIGNGLEQNYSYQQSGERNISFILTDSLNCRKSYSAKIFVKEGPSFQLGNDTVICEANSLTIYTPRIPSYQYTWNTGDSANFITVFEPGSYWLRVKDPELNCTFSDTLNIKVLPSPQGKINSGGPYCTGETIHLSANTDSNVKSIKWLQDKKEIGNSNNVSFKPIHNSELILEVSDNFNCVNRDTINIELLSPPTVTIKDTSLCPGDSILILSKTNDAHPIFKYQWSFNGLLLPEDSLPYIKVKAPGTLKLIYGKDNCVTNAIAQIGLYPSPDITGNEDLVVLCEEDGGIVLDAGIAEQYHWLASNGKDRLLEVHIPGSYTVALTNQYNCRSVDSIIVENRCPPQIYVPNAFTPDMDGPNKLHTIYGYNIGSFELTIFNRWGEIIYRTNNILTPWDGRYKEEPMPSGVYAWIINYTGNNPDYGNVQQLEGKVVLVR